MKINKIIKMIKISIKIEKILIIFIIRLKVGNILRDSKKIIILKHLIKIVKDKISNSAIVTRKDV